MAAADEFAGSQIRLDAIDFVSIGGLPWGQNAIFFSLTAIEMAWFAPLVMIFLPETWRTPPIVCLLGLWGLMLA